MFKFDSGNCQSVNNHLSCFFFFRGKYYEFVKYVVLDLFLHYCIWERSSRRGQGVSCD